LSSVQKVGEYILFNQTLPERVMQMTVLMTARRWTQQYEWNAHYERAVKAGLKKEIIDAIGEGRRPAGMSEDEETAYDFTMELDQTGGVADITYSRAIARFRDQGVLDLIAVNGYYSMLSMVLNVARTPLRPGDTPKLKPFAR
jgi:4-carboxymuconolactone decarboxylase